MQVDKKTMLSIGGFLLLCILVNWGLHNPAVVGSALGWIGGLLAPFAIGGALAFIMHVPLNAIERRLPPTWKRGRRGLALGLTLLAVVAVLALVVGLVVPQVVDTAVLLGQRWPAFWESLQEWADDLAAQAPLLQNILGPEVTLPDLSKLLDWLTGWLTERGSAWLGNTMAAAGNAAGAVVNFFLGLVFSIYILLQKEKLAHQCKMLLYAVAPRRRADALTDVCSLANQTFSSFLSGQCLEACILGCMFAVSMLICRMPYITLISVLIAVTALIPVIGSFIGCVVGALLICVQNPWQAVGFVVLFLLLQQIEGNFIYPRVVGSSVGLPPIWVLTAVTLGGSLFGVLGILFMIPAVSVLYALLRRWTHRRLHERDIVPEEL